MNGKAELIRHVMIGGRWIIYDGRVLTIDEPVLITRYPALIDKLWQRFTP
jgi:hypothetical protein